MKTIKKWIMAVCMGMALMAGMTGCTKTTEVKQQAQEETGSGTDTQGISEMPQKQSDGEPDEAPEQSDGEPDEVQKQSDGEPDEAPEQSDEEPDKAENTQSGQSEPFKVRFSEGAEHLGGKVQSVEKDGMIFAQTTIMGEEDGMVTLVDEKDAKKIFVKFTVDTKVEHWTIQGGGAGIDMKDASLSDLKAGLGVELEGFYEGETFVAMKILIEEYK